ncbi:MAG: flavin monoamine oxidase family protein [Candidatus Binataceae bacterium]
MTEVRVAVIGGGMGGLMTAFLLEKRAHFPCQITIFETSNRLGGKLITGQFDSAPVLYEAGAAELYDYSRLGSDPLHELIAEIGLSTRPMDGQTVVLGDTILTSRAQVREELGDAAYRALRDFRRMARAAISPADYYESDWKADNQDPLSRQSFRDLLTSVESKASRYLEVAVHSDLATEPHLTSAMYGLQNYLMNEPDYMRLYTIEGGLERLPRKLAERIRARVLLNSRVFRVEKTSGPLYRVSYRRCGENLHDEFDYVAVALPNDWLPAITWGGAALADAMHRHHVFYDYPAHYLRVSVLFEKPFWRESIAGSYFMLDAFGGCCVYDESSRNSPRPYGVLGWLLAGEAARAMSNYDDEALTAAVLDSLPQSLRHGVCYRREARVHRWIGAVNGKPGGYPVRDPDSRHQPDPVEHPELFLVGDYLFDSTINGVLDSADVVADWIVEDIEEEAAIMPEITAAAAELASTSSEPD